MTGIGTLLRAAGARERERHGQPTSTQNLLFTQLSSEVSTLVVKALYAVEPPERGVAEVTAAGTSGTGRVSKGCSNRAACSHSAVIDSNRGENVLNTRQRSLRSQYRYVRGELTPRLVLARPWAVTCLARTSFAAPLPLLPAVTSS